MLIAWDPVQRKEVWRVDQQDSWNGGLLCTASDLVFQGTQDGHFIAYDAKDGSKLWDVAVGGGVVAPPVTYMLDGKQYITLLVGWGGGVGLKFRSTPLQPGRIFTFVLGGNKPFPVFSTEAPRTIPDISFTASETEIARGKKLFNTYCGTCHMLGKTGGGLVPNLAFIPENIHKSFLSIVHDGAYLPLGMPKFGDRISEQDVLNIQKFILTTAKEIKKEMGREEHQQNIK